MLLALVLGLNTQSNAYSTELNLGTKDLSATSISTSKLRNLTNFLVLKHFIYFYEKNRWNSYFP